MKVQDRCVVSIHYTLTSDDGDIIDSSSGKEALVYLHGSKALIPGLERELADKMIGDRIEVTVQPEDGYGLVDPELIQQVDRSVLEGVEALRPGMQLEATNQEGHRHFVIVQKIDEDRVTLNANPPLAGHVLHFDVTIEAIRDATEEEIGHGHAH